MVSLKNSHLIRLYDTVYHLVNDSAEEQDRI